MYRINFLLVTVGFAFLGCGPGEGRFYEIEKQLGQTNALAERVASLEQATESLPQDNLEVQTQAQADLEVSLQALTQRVASIERQVGTFKQVAPTETKTSEAQVIRTELTARIARLEKRLSEQAVQDRPSAMADAKQPVVANKPRDTGGFQTTLLSWNVESEGSDPRLIAKQLTEFNRYDIYGLCEVLPESIDLYASALGDDFKTIASRSGFNDRLQIIYDAKVYKLLRRLELDEINFERRYRSPLVAHLEHRATGQQLLVMNNHLARGRAEVRQQQAKQLVEWARDQTVPIVAVGDYNFDYVFSTRKGNDGFVAMMRDGIWKWVEPAELIDTNWYDSPKRPDGIDDYPGSMLDFAFVAGASTQWKAECRIITREGDFPDDETTSDHRPFELRLIAN